MDPLDRITIDPNIMNGQPCIRGMRLTVKRLLSALASYPSREELTREFPEVEEDDIKQALEYAARNVEDRIIPLSGTRG
jgi:uncharacterized protein (DUF433 family)